MIRNPYLDKGVILSPVDDVIQTDENLGPQFIRVRHGNNSSIFLNSQTAKNISLNGSKFSLGTGHNLFVTKIKRFAAQYFKILWCVPNVNVRNNTISFWSSNTGGIGGTLHTVTIPEGFYATSTALMAALQTALNTVSGASSLIFTITVNPLNICSASITTSGGNFAFNITQNMAVNSSGILKGKPLWNLPTEQVLNSSKNIGPINLFYTEYINIASFALHQYTKNPSYSDNSIRNGQLFERVHISDPTKPSKIEFQKDTLQWINFNRNRSLNDIDITLYDQFGDPLYIPQLSTGNINPLDLSMVIVTEL